MDVFCGAETLAVVIYAILNGAVDALDVLFALSLFVHHFSSSLSFFSKFLTRRFHGRRTRFGFFADDIIIPNKKRNYIVNLR